MKYLPFISAIAAASIAAAAEADPADLIARGEYLATVMDCAGCHMPRGSDGAPLFDASLSGGTVGFELPGLGIFWAPNLTPDASGLGNWSDSEIAAAITGGLRPDGRVLAPVMPWMAYSVLEPGDTDALVAYLRSLPEIEAPRLEPVAEASLAEAPFFRVVAPNH